MFLKSNNLYLRAVEPSDLEFLYELENDTDIWSVSNTPVPFSRNVLQQYIENATADIYATRQLRLIICTLQHEPAGTIDLYDFDPLHARAGIGIIITETHRRQKLATEALDVLLQYCRDYLLLHQVYCTIAADNQASINLFEKAAFNLVGTRQQWLRTPTGWQDVLEYQKILLI